MYVVTALEGCFTSGCLCTQLAPGTVAPRTGYAADQEGSLTFDGLCGSVSFSDDRTDTSGLICSRYQEGSFAPGGVYGSGSSCVHFYSRKILTNYGYDKSSSDVIKNFCKDVQSKVDLSIDFCGDEHVMVKPQGCPDVAGRVFSLDPT